MKYYNILQLKEEGFSISKIAKKVSLTRNTVKKYLKMTPEEMEDWLATLDTRQKKLDPFRDTILTWLQEHPDLTSAQVYDWLEEKCEYKGANENTVNNYVKELRQLYHIPKTTIERQYSATDELSMGFQAQVDFGQDVLSDNEGNLKRCYFIAFVLSHSRHKYFEWLDRPFKTIDVIRCHENAFHYYGGKPEEIVYDQDALIAVSENAGDIVYTAEFQRYRMAQQFNIYLCRKSDPETKGKIENVVKFVKRNFSKNRTYSSLELLNEQSWKWLDRTGNYKVHNTTKKRPFEVFALEKPHLKKVSTSFSYENSSTVSITRKIHKDNTIRYEGNRYSVPLGTFKQGSSNIVYLDITTPGYLLIRLKANGAVLVNHSIPEGKGELIKDPSHQRPKSSKAELLSHQVMEAFNDQQLINWYVDQLKEKYPRHLIDQLKVMDNAIKSYPDFIDAGLEKAKMLNLISANDFRDIVFSLHKEAAEPITHSTGSDSKYSHMKAVERDTGLYLKVLGGMKP